MRIPELGPLGEPRFEASVRAMVSACLANSPAGGWVESVLTLATQRLELRPPVFFLRLVVLEVLDRFFMRLRSLATGERSRGCGAFRSWHFSCASRDGIARFSIYESLGVHLTKLANWLFVSDSLSSQIHVEHLHCVCARQSWPAARERELEAAEWPFFFSAWLVARDRVADGFLRLPLCPLR